MVKIIFVEGKFGVNYLKDGIAPCIQKLVAIFDSVNVAHVKHQSEDIRVFYYCCIIYRCDTQ